MDEIWFHLSNQIESLQIQASVVAQQGQQWCILWLSQLRQFLQQLSNEESIQHVKDIALHIAASTQSSLKDIQIHFHNTHWNTIDLCRQLGILCAGKISRRDAIFCITGVAVGTMVGYYMGVNTKLPYNSYTNVRAIACYRYDDLENVFIMEDREVPTIIKPKELLICVYAASVNVVDTKICSGYSKFYRRLLNSGKQKGLPVTLGRDCAGMIMHIGRSVINFDVGDEVFLAVPSWAPGTMAEYIIVSETQVAKRPKSCSIETCASLPYNGCLAWDALVNRSVIKEGNAKGKTVFIYGGCTPIGCILTQLIKLWGGYVLTTCRRKAKPVMKTLGADDVIIIGEENIEQNLQLYYGFDAIFYTDSNEPFEERILRKYLKPNGSYVSTVPEQLTSDSLGFICETIFAGCVRIKLLVQYIFGFNVHQWNEGAKLNVAYLRVLRELVDAKQLQPVVGQVYTLNGFRRALSQVLDPNSIGSTIIMMK
ncbi:PREDICTED: reticulon-4-interacting protein 1 homolog, mitochondrial-like [Dinoponera quadriceps]|uniref:Reticulon-4-interacting protein 1 homolog, mitochondrial-like n=1 Tax=Dinoponera quadriceps TaxID=609295 RepID=A0A6P3XKK6_DINQU|nr:PREDICTED: reticulon-4-interacting protein 1 homolog, mitochondrial-like [Dinoponera quadriceps]XP_014478783.1 PREDICTED: reticulon-4-interacting protein 1 homolog, mitochondrial-like [Dinoponera quadriceps]